MVIRIDSALCLSDGLWNAVGWHWQASGYISGRHIRKAQRILEAAAQEDVIFGISIDGRAVIEHAKTAADRGLAIAPRIPSHTNTRCNRKVVLRAKLFTIGRLVTSYACWWMSEDISIQ